jgi:hypothetical protein
MVDFSSTMTVEWAKKKAAGDADGLPFSAAPNGAAALVIDTEPRR